VNVSGWRSFSNFYFDVGKRPSWRHLLIRDDPAGEFSPGNAPMAGWAKVSTAATDRADASPMTETGHYSTLP
jgi:hypothetical protein